MLTQLVKLLWAYCNGRTHAVLVAKLCLRSGSHQAGLSLGLCIQGRKSHLFLRELVVGHATWIAARFPQVVILPKAFNWRDRPGKARCA